MSEVPEAAREFQIEMSPETEAGVYADFVSLWHTPDVFVLDFAALKGPPQLAERGDGRHVQQFPTRVVARVRIPPAQIFEVMRALEQQLSMWEEETGRREPGTPPPEGAAPPFPG